jgi:hypothetical protein
MNQLRFAQFGLQSDYLAKRSGQRNRTDRASAFNCQRAAGTVDKIGSIGQGKTGTEVETARELFGTHTTLPLCVPAMPANPQKTAIYKPIRFHSCDREARVWHGFAYMLTIELRYFNGLISRQVLLLSAKKTR